MFSPLWLGRDRRIFLKNRLGLAPLTNCQSGWDGAVSYAERQWLRRRAVGGFGMVISAAAFVHPSGHTWQGQIGLHSDSVLGSWKILAREVHQNQCLILAQLYHGGLRVDPRVSQRIPVSPSSLPIATDGTYSEELSEPAIEELIEAFAQAAARAHEASLDGIELHGAHGYLICQFLSRTQNRRSDRWGGSLENRQRFLLKVLHACRAATSPAFLIGVRLSPEDYGITGIGMNLEDSLTTTAALESAGADFIHWSMWNVHKNAEERPHEPLLPLLRQAAPRLPMIVAGALTTPSDVQRALDSGADIAMLGKIAIAHADWPLAARDQHYMPKLPPHPRSDLAAQDVSPAFVSYLGRFKNFVSE